MNKQTHIYYEKIYRKAPGRGKPKNREGGGKGIRAGFPTKRGEKWYWDRKQKRGEGGKRAGSIKSIGKKKIWKSGGGGERKIRERELQSNFLVRMGSKIFSQNWGEEEGGKRRAEKRGAA